MSYAIQVSRLKKSYGGHAVLREIGFDVLKGETFALLGVNGAGKTTALECIEGLRRYDGGSITVNGSIGIQLQSASLPAYIRPMEAVRLFAKWNHTEPNVPTLCALGIDTVAKKRYHEPVSYTHLMLSSKAISSSLTYPAPRIIPSTICELKTLMYFFPFSALSSVLQRMIL